MKRFPNLRLHKTDSSSLDRELREAAFYAEGIAKIRAPVDEGALRASIHSKPWRGGYAVATGQHYAAFQEFGTGRRGLANPANTEYGVPSWYQHGSKAGIKGTAFLRPAAAQAMKRLMQRLK